MIINHPEIYPMVCDDNAFADLSGPLEIPGYWDCIVAYVDDIAAGCFVLHPSGTKATMEVHVQLLPEYREDSKSICDALLAYAWDLVSANKFVACIPFDCANVKDFAEKMGFKIEGINEGSIMRGGELLDQWYVGIKRWV